MDRSAVLSIAAVGLSLVSPVTAFRRRGLTPGPSGITELRALACLLSAVALAMAAIQPFPAATTAAAFGLLCGFPLIASGIYAEMRGSTARGPYPEWWWYTAYTASIVGLVLLGVLVATLTSPSRLGTIPQLHTPIVAAAAIILSVLPHGPTRREAAIAGAAGAVVVAFVCAAWSFSDFAQSAEVNIAFGWVIGVVILNLTRSTRKQQRNRAEVYAAESLGIAMRVGLVALAVGLLVMIDMALRVPLR